MKIPLKCLACYWYHHWIAKVNPQTHHMEDCNEDQCYRGEEAHDDFLQDCPYFKELEPL